MALKIITERDQLGKLFVLPTDIGSFLLGINYNLIINYVKSIRESEIALVLCYILSNFFVQFWDFQNYLVDMDFFKTNIVYTINENAKWKMKEAIIYLNPFFYW